MFHIVDFVDVLKMGLLTFASPTLFGPVIHFKQLYLLFKLFSLLIEILDVRLVGFLNFLELFAFLRKKLVLRHHGLIQVLNHFVKFNYFQSLVCDHLLVFPLFDAEVLPIPQSQLKLVLLLNDSGELRVKLVKLTCPLLVNLIHI